MSITITGGMQFTGGLSSVDSPSLTINNDVISIRDNSTLITTTYGFTDIVDFTRASSATYVGSNGLINTTPASKNLLTYTQELDNTWSKQNVTITPNTTIAPNNTTTADTVVATASTALHLVSQGPNVVSGTTYTFSIYVKAGTHSFVQLALNFAAFGAVYANFNITTGTVGNSSGASPTITNITDGWYRCTVTAAATTSGNGAPGIALVSSNTATRLESWTTTGTETIIAWGAQLEVGSTATSYTRNYGSVYPPRFDYDPVTLQPKGFLVEEQRTNFVTYSDQFDNVIWTKNGSSIQINQTIAPDGTSNADAIYETALSSWHGVSQSYSGTSGQTYTLTAFMKKGNRTYGCLSFAFNNLNGCYVQVDLTNGSLYNFATGTGFSITSSSSTYYGNGWWKVTLTGTYGAGNIVYPCVAVAGDTLWTSGGLYNNMYVGDASKFMYAWGVQLELGSFATSYIPTVASTVTRSPDVASISGTNFSSWYNQAEGTLLLQSDVQFGATRYLFTGTASQRMAYGTSGGALGMYDGVNAAVSVSGTPSGQTVKLATRYSNSDGLAISLNGGSVVTSVSYSGSFSTMSSVGIFNVAAGSTPTTGHVRAIQYYPYRLTNAQLQSLTI